MHAFLAYVFCFFSLIIISPIIGILFLSIIGTFLEVFINNISKTIGFNFISDAFSTFSAVYFGYLFCSWMNVDFSPFMYVLPGIGMLLNDHNRFQKARMSMSPSAAKFEMMAALGDITGLTIGILVVMQLVS